MTPNFQTHSAPSRHVEVEGTQYLWFSGTDYLGMAFHPQLIEALTEGFKTLGVHFGSSRNNTLQISSYRQAELALMRHTGAEDAILVSSGMLAGVIVRKSLAACYLELYTPQRVEEHEAPLLHPALRRFIPAESDWQKWAEKKAEDFKKDVEDVLHLVFSDAIGTPETTHFDFSVFRDLKNCILVVDDSHALGVLGHQGAGSFAFLKSAGIENLLVVASLNKAMGIPGGVILGEKAVLDKIRRTATYAGASPIPPVYAQALTQMVDKEIYPVAHARLTQNNRFFLDRLGAKRDHFLHAPDYPVYTTAEPGLFGFLYERKILTSSFHYPTEQAPLLTRIVISAVHTEEDLIQLAQGCIDYFDACSRR
jgi:8-amino-7-oxononanoate synthase